MTDESEELYRQQKRSGSLEALVSWHKKIWRTRIIAYEYDNVFTGIVFTCYHYFQTCKRDSLHDVWRRVKTTNQSMYFIGSNTPSSCLICLTSAMF